tara:strand:- start:61 stop:261 length:201 start_codon:yes stop_codon:yes gene_type:complete
MKTQMRCIKSTPGYKEGEVYTFFLAGNVLRKTTGLVIEKIRDNFEPVGKPKPKPKSKIKESSDGAN